MMDLMFPMQRKIVRKKKFTKEEDDQLREFVNEFGEDKWEEISKRMINRNPRQCHDRWKYYLSPKVNNEPFTQEEDQLLIKLVSKYGGMWVQISKKFKNRSDIQMKNRWNVLKKQFNVMVPSFTYPFEMNSFRQPPQFFPLLMQQSSVNPVIKPKNSKTKKPKPISMKPVTAVAEIKHNAPIKEEKTYNQIILDLEMPEFEF